MKSFRILSKALSLILIFCTAVSLLVSCKGDDTDGDRQYGDLFSLADFKIIRPDNASDALIRQTANLKDTLEAKLGLSLTVAIAEDEEKSDSAKEILVGRTDRSESADALSYLAQKTDKDAYVVQINENSIVIVGTTEMATVRAIKIFIEKYVDVSPENNKIGIDVSAGKTQAGLYDSDNTIIASNGVEFDVELVSTVYQVPENNLDPSLLSSPFMVSNVSYPSVIQLSHQKNENDNGKLITVHYLSGDHISGDHEKTDAAVMMSTNNGRSWKCISRPVEKMDTSLNEGQMPHIYELPAQLGDMPAGTLIFSANSVNYSAKSTISLWRSFDCGYTWEQYALIASGGGDRFGVWEPFTIYGEDDGYLYCFYSDDTGSTAKGSHDQTIVYRRTKDGVNWEMPVEVVACEDSTARAGMPVITKMGNGKYLMVFELVHKFDGAWGAPIFYKTADSLSDWGDPKNYGNRIEYGEALYIESGPAVAWLPAGGENGTLVVTSRYGCENKILVSFDYGKSWEAIKNPLPFTLEKDVDNSRMGYSAGFWVGDDGKTLYYVNCINSSYDTERRQIAFARIKIY